jgi:prepilin peptidase CpaA
MSLDLVKLVPAVAFALLLITAAVFDIRERRIPNWSVVALIGVFVAAGFLKATPQGWTPSLMAFGAALCGSAILYLRGVIGAGDSKLFSVAALFVGFGNLLFFACVTAMAGGVLAMVYLLVLPQAIIYGLAPPHWAQDKSAGIPYGVAIAVAGILTAVTTGFLPSPYQSAPDPRAVERAQAAYPAAQ